MQAQKICSCGAVMNICGRQTVHMNGKPCLMELSTNFRPVDLYLCPQCHRLAFFAPWENQSGDGQEQAMEFYQDFTTQQLREILVDDGYTAQIRAGVRELLQEKG